MSISNNLIKSEIYSILELKDGQYYLNDDHKEEKLQYLTNKEYTRGDLEESHIEEIQSNIASYKLTAFQHNVIAFLAGQKQDIVKIDNIDFLKSIDFYKDVYQNSKSTTRYNKEFLDLAITRIFIGRDNKGNEVRYAIQPLSFKITKKTNGNKNLEVALNPFLRRDLQVGYQKTELTKDEDYNRFLMLLNNETLNFTKHTFAITANNLAYSILKTKEHLRTKGNRHKKILSILELFARENNDRNICYLKLSNDEDLIVYYKKYLPYKKTEIKEVYFKSGRLYG